MDISSVFPELNGKLGFGCMRLPMKGSAVDKEEFCRMADAFIEAGFNYFDTAHGYIDGLSETAIGECVSSRYDRSRFLLTDKLTDPYFKKQEDIRPFFMKQLEWCRVGYFDLYLMHAQDRNNYKKFTAFNAHKMFNDWNASFYYDEIITGGDRAKASECIKCGLCERVCPQHLPIRELLDKAAGTFER